MAIRIGSNFVNVVMYPVVHSLNPRDTYDLYLATCISVCPNIDPFTSVIITYNLCVNCSTAVELRLHIQTCRIYL